MVILVAITATADAEADSIGGARGVLGLLSAGNTQLSGEQVEVYIRTAPFKVLLQPTCVAIRQTI